MEKKVGKGRVKEGLRGGEKKGNEMLEMGMVEGSLGIVEERDWGVDVDGLGIVGDGLKKVKSGERRGMVMRE